MFCHHCGKEIPDGAKFCNFCGKAMPEAGPRHARPEPEEIFSYSDGNRPSEFDVNELDEKDMTKVYNFAAFEDNSPASEHSDDPVADDRENIDDSYENYQDGEDDDTFMDKLDNKFRRDEYDRKPPQNNKLWLWITLGVLAVVLIIVFAIMAFSGTFSGNKKALPTAATTATTAKATEKPKPTDAPKPTQAPEPTYAPDPTEAPPEPTDEPQPITEAPKPPTDPPVEPTDPPMEPTDPPVEPTDLPTAEWTVE